MVLPQDGSFLDAADIDCDSVPPPEGWSPEVTDDDPDLSDVQDDGVDDDE